MKGCFYKQVLQIPSITIFIVITLLLFNNIIKLYHFDVIYGVIRLHNNNNYDYKVYKNNNHFIIYKWITYCDMN